MRRFFGLGYALFGIKGPKYMVDKKHNWKNGAKEEKMLPKQENCAPNV